MSSNKFQLISIIALGFVLFGGFLLFSADFAFAATPTLSSTCGGVTGDGSSNPTGMVSPGGPFINLSWSAVPNTVEYQIYRKVGSGPWEPLGSRLPAGTTSHIDKLVESLTNSYHLLSAGPLQYYVQAILSDGGTAGTEDDAQSIAIPRCVPFLRVETVCSPGARGFHLYFTAARDISIHRVFRDTELIGSLTLADDLGPPNSPQEGHFYFEDGSGETATRNYWIVADQAGVTWKSNEVLKTINCSLTAPAPDPPVITEVDPFCEDVGGTLESRVHLEWTPSDNILGYTVWRRVQGDTGVGESRGDFITTWMNDDTEGSGGTNFEYGIEAVGTGGRSPINFTGPVTAPACTTPLPPPDFITPTPDANCDASDLGVDLEWVASVGAEKYKIFRGPDAASLSIIREFIQGDSEFASRTWRDTGVVSAQTYFYKIEAHGPVGTTPSASTVESVTTVDCSAPGAFTLTLDQAPYCEDAYLRSKLSWTNSASFTSYTLHRNQVSPSLTTPIPNAISQFTDIGLGRALDFDGSTNYVNIPHNSLLNANAPFTLAVWVKANTWAGLARGIFGKGTSTSGSGGYDLRVDNDGTQVNLVKYFVVDQRVSFSSPLQSDRWYHLAAVQLSDRVKYYLDGVPIGDFVHTGAFQSNTATAYIGKARTGFNFSGIIDDARLYSRALSAMEIADLYNSTTVSGSGLVGLWHLDEGSGTDASDSSNNGNHGTLVNSPAWVESGMFYQRGYNWQAEAIGPGGNIFSNTTSPDAVAPMCKPPKPGTSLLPVCESGVPGVEVEVSYSINANAVGGYEISRGGLLIKTLNQSSLLVDRTFVDTGLAPLTPYTYRVKAIGSVGQDESEPNIITALDCSPPTIPQNVTAEFVCVGTGDTSPPRSRIGWDDSDNATSYDLYIDENDDGTYTVLTNFQSDTDPVSGRYSYDYPILVNTKYAFWIIAVGPGGESDPSDIARIDPATHADGNYCKPPAPAITTLTTTCTGGNPVNTLSWAVEATPNNTASYEIYRNTTNTIPGAPIASGVTATTWPDTTLVSPGDSSTTFYYWVKAVGAGPTALESAASASQSVQTLACGIIPGVPQNVSVTDSFCSLGTPMVELSWDSSPNAMSYNVFRNDGAAYKGVLSPFIDDGGFFQDDFTGVTSAPWKDEWTIVEASGNVNAFLQDNRGRIKGSTNLARTVFASYSRAQYRDSEQFLGYVNIEDINTQRGFFARRSDSNPNTYYRLYHRGNSNIVAISRVVDNTETVLAWATFSNTYIAGMRARVEQTPTGTELKFKIWRVTDSEPASWTLETLDTRSALQQVSGRAGIYSATGGSRGLRWHDFDNYEITILPPAELLEHGETYTYTVSAVGVDTESGPSDPVEATTLDCRPLEQVPTTELQCDLNTALPYIALTWLADGNTQYWDLWRKKTSEDDTHWTLINADPIVDPMYDDFDVESGEEYHYFLEAWSALGESFTFDVSDPIVADPVVCPAPATPQIVGNGTFSYCAGSVPRNRVEWTEDPISGRTKEFRVHRSPGGLMATTTPITTIFIDNLTLADSGNTYSYIVEAIGTPETNTAESNPVAIFVKEQCDELPPEPFTVFTDPPAPISRGDLRAVFLEWTTAETEEYFKVFRTEGYENEGELTNDVNTQPFSAMFTELAELVRGVHYDDELDPVTGRILYTDSEGVPVNVLEDGLYYWYRVIAYRTVGVDLEDTPADADPVFLPIARPGLFTLSFAITGDPEIVEFDWTAAEFTAKGGEPVYDVERSRRTDFVPFTVICDNVSHSVRVCNDLSPQRGLTYYRVRATNNGGDTFSNIVQAGLHLFPEELREISPF